MNDSTSKANHRPILGIKQTAVSKKAVQTPAPAKKTVLMKSSHAATDPDATTKKAGKVKTADGDGGVPRPSQKITWQELETIVRSGAEAKFGARARAETIAGVKCDCVIDLQNGSVVLIEISKENTLEKLRTDLAKFNVLRPFFFGKQIFPKCHFITLDEPTEALIESGKANYVEVQSISQFLNYLFGTLRYGTVRRTLPFGSAVDIYSGQPDQTKYVKVSYFDEAGNAFTTERIAEELLNNRTIVLIGDYGAGKSRCVKELFELLHFQQKENYRHSIAINLKDNWGLKRASEIITRHFTDIGLEDQVADALKVSYSPSAIYLLDGFDEIGAQTWSDDPTKLVSIRRQSLVGVKDLIDKARGGVLVTGREHYFNNDAELITCLGLDRKSPLFLRCNQELSADQFAEMIGRKSPEFPSWMPKKPLIASIIRDIEEKVFEPILATASGQIDFWNLLIDTFCEREANINAILDQAIIRELYTKIGRLSRSTSTALGPISIKQINDAFEETTGRPPTDESAIILQRLPGLGRIGAESLDRQFVDSFILDGLKAEDALGLLAHVDGSWLDADWKNPVEEFGAFYIATRLTTNKQVGMTISFIQRNSDRKNKIIISDLLSALFRLEDGDIDLGGLTFGGGKFYHMALGDSKVRNISIRDSSFDTLDLTDAEPIGINISDSVITRMSGVTSREHLPTWIVDCLVEDFQNLKTLVAIREAGLSIAQTFLLSSLRKLFLQPGSGRRESSMYKGYGDSTTKRICEKVIALLLKERFCSKVKGASEALFIPDRSFGGRVQAIMSQMTISRDELWLQTSRIV
jgi:ABC-type dipeptide/oligopeptide/nickel transport system ATPase component